MAGRRPPGIFGFLAGRADFALGATILSGRTMTMVPATAAFLGRRPSQLSGGRRQRVAPGRAIVHRPTRFLVDQPLSNLDAKLRISTRAQIGNLHHRLHSTMIRVTRDRIEATTPADRAVVMTRGRIRHPGTPTDSHDRPPTPSPRAAAAIRR